LNIYERRCVAALNTPMQRASAQVFLNVLRDSLGAGRAASDLLLARSDLTALFPKPAADYVRACGGQVEVGATVDGITRDDTGFILQVQGHARRFDRVICALAPHRVTPLLAGIAELNTVAQQIEALQYEPIHSCGCSSAACSPAVTDDRPRHSPAQWLFDAGDLRQRGLIRRDQRFRTCRRSGALPVVWSRISKKLRCAETAVASRNRRKNALSVAPGRSALRQDACPGFMLAGDYVAGDYPATIEAAVRSGIAAARLVR
jgi:predicted NAD/FAD-binding protein